MKEQREMKPIKREDLENYLNIDTKDPMLRRLDQKMAEGFDLQAVIDAHREELARLEELDSYLTIVKADYDKKQHVRQAVEMIYTAKMDFLYHLARRFHPLSTYGKSLLRRAEECREEFEATVGPLVTRITEENLESFRAVIPPCFADEIKAKRSRALGAIRSDLDRIFPAGALVYTWDELPGEEGPRLRIRWIQVNREYGRQGVCEHLIALMVGLLIRKNGAALTCEIPLSDGMMVMGDLLTEWHFSFAPMMTPDYCCLLRDIRSRGELLQEKTSAVSLTVVPEAQRKLLIRQFLVAVGAQGNQEVLAAPADYYDPEVSCLCRDAKGTAALLLAHKYPGNRLFVELLDAKPGQEALLADLLVYAARRSLEKYDRKTEFCVRTSSYEQRTLCERLFPDQRVCFYVNSLLTKVEAEEDLDEAAVETLLAAYPQEFNRTEELL